MMLNADLLPPDTIDEINNYWVSHLGCPPAELFDANTVVLPHSAFKGYQGLFLVRRRDAVMISCPNEIIDLIHTLTRDQSPQEVFGSGLWRRHFPDLIDSVVGPGFVAYCDASVFRAQPMEGSIPLGEGEIPDLQRLQMLVDEEDWLRSGLERSHPALFGHYVNGELVAAAGYEIWGGRIAHIGVATHPAHTGQGYGKAVVSAVTQDAIEEGLIAQFRALRSHAEAAAIADTLGFARYAETFAVGLNLPRLLDMMNEDPPETYPDESFD